MYERILVPYDGSPTSTRGLDEAVKLAKLTGARLRLIHVVDAMAFATGFESYAGYASDLIPLMQETGAKLLEEGKARVAASGLEVDSVIPEKFASRVSDLVVEEAKSWRADLIVIGTHGRRGMGRVLMGSDAEQILRTAPVPVLLVRAPEAPAGGDAGKAA